MQTTLDFFNVVVMQINHKEKLTYVTKKSTQIQHSSLLYKSEHQCFMCTMPAWAASAVMGSLKCYVRANKRLSKIKK